MLKIHSKICLIEVSLNAFTNSQYVIPPELSVSSSSKNESASA